MADNSIETASFSEPDAGVSLADAAVITQRELGWEQLFAHARTLGGDPALAPLSDHDVEVALHARAGELTIALARLFDLLAEFVVRGIWADQGCRTPGTWLSWKLGLGASTAREWVRVALRLRELPTIRAASRPAPCPTPRSGP
ncbi:hypothetical protein [Egicoccus sp. AB-alg2]|uniref:hypothetical protein n=1 Tax=Egicoccus sp. AB-alg2 TaxID=3242693 RepID=UPI00359EA45A